MAEYFLSRYERTRDPADLAYARRQADDLLQRGTSEGETERWIRSNLAYEPD